LTKIVGQPSKGVAVNMIVLAMKTIAGHNGKYFTLINEIPNNSIPRNQNPQGKSSPNS
jgi:hypothetical protein